MTQTQQFTHRWPTSVLNDAVETEVVDTTTTEQPKTRSPQPTKKGQAQAKPARVVPAQFAIAHGKTFDLFTVTLTMFMASAQAVMSNRVDPTGFPGTQAFWLGMAIAVPALFIVASKTGNERMWLVAHKMAIALAISPGWDKVLHFVFGG